MAPNPFAMTLKENDDFATVSQRQPIGLVGAKTEQLKALFYETVMGSYDIKVEFLKDGHPRVATGKVLELEQSPNFPAVVIEGERNPIPLNQITTFVYLGENNFLVSFAKNNLRRADGAFGAQVKKDKCHPLRSEEIS